MFSYTAAKKGLGQKSAKFYCLNCFLKLVYSFLRSKILWLLVCIFDISLTNEVGREQRKQNTGKPYGCCELC